MRSWWSRRWARLFEASAMSSRLSRGRQYARAGAVIDMTIRRGSVHALVQGSRRRPYSVDVEVDPLSPAEWREVARVLAGESGLLAQVLSGSLPERLETLLASRGVSLFPQPVDLWAPANCSCSCPDEANPCKHICAVFYTLLERLEADPLLTFVLRGKTVDEVLREVRRYRTEAPQGIPACNGMPVFEGMPAEQGVSAVKGMPAGEAAAAGEEAASLPDVIEGALPQKYLEFWGAGDAAHPPADPGSPDILRAGGSSVPAESLSGGTSKSGRSESGRSKREFALPPLPFSDKESLGRRAIEQVYLLAGRAAKKYLEQMNRAKGKDRFAWSLR